MQTARAAGVTLILYYATALTEMGLHNERITALLSMLTALYAIILAAAFHRLTRDVDAFLALVAFSCRFAEAMGNAASAVVRLANSTALLSAIGTVSGTIFAIGSTIFACLFLRGRIVPSGLAWIGVVGSAIVIPVFALRGFGLVESRTLWLASIPLIIFEAGLAVRLVSRGVPEA